MSYRLTKQSLCLITADQGVYGSLTGTAEGGAQLMVDLLSWQTNKERGKLWELGNEESVTIFKETVIDLLENNEKIRRKFAERLLIDVRSLDDEFVVDVIDNLDSFVKAVK